MKPTTIMLPDDLHETVREKAFSMRISMGELIRQAIEEYLKGGN